MAIKLDEDQKAALSQIGKWIKSGRPQTTLGGLAGSEIILLD